MNKEKLTTVVVLDLVVISLILSGTSLVSVATAVTITTSTSTTPIKHLVVIFQENVAFDHYFATYPNAINPVDEPHFSHLPDTPSTNGLTTPGLLTSNTNLANPSVWINPNLQQ